ncbi:MAG TPA: hypothetical protein VHL53_03860, partial [Acidimicrobiia bacterium]|nr:hypothetical protein [Acidimicrobiia bacterium]
TRPRLASLLEHLGADEQERVDALTTMLHHAAPDEYDEAVAIFEEAVGRTMRAQARARAEEERARRQDGDRVPADRERRVRFSAAAERRAQRRRGA